MCEDRPDHFEELPEFATQWWEQRQLGFQKLQELREQKLRAMTEASAAEIFSQLDPVRPYPLRPSSGLVEQQRWFRRLRNQQAGGQPPEESGG